MRKNYFVSGVAASYVSLAATVIYGLALVPMALRYLEAEEFGLWMVLVQISTYFTLLEFGVFPAAARTLIEFKDHTSTGSYGSSIITATFIFSIQSIGILIAGVAFADDIVALISVPGQLVTEATFLLKWFVVASALGTFSKIWCAVLYANHRMDLVALIQGFSPLLGLGISWWILAQGYGLRGLPPAIVLPVIVSGGLYFAAVLKLKLLPRRAHWKLPTVSDFRSMLTLSIDVFLVNIGQQLLQASQLLIVSRSMGLTAAAIWSVSTKLFSLIYQFIIKIDNTAIVAFAEMIVRKEQNRLKLRFRNIFQLTAALAVVGFVSAAGLNSLFVELWTGRDLIWDAMNGWFLAALMTVNLLLHCQTDLIIHSKQVGALRFLIFVEGVTFVAVALMSAPQHGFSAVIISALLCALIFRAPYCMSRVRQLLLLDKNDTLLQWLFPAMLGTSIMAAVSFIVVYLTANLQTSLMSGALGLILYASASILCLYFVLIPLDFRSELIRLLFMRCGKRTSE